MLKVIIFFLSKFLVKEISSNKNTNEISCNNFSTILNNLTPKSDLKTKQKSILSTTTISNDFEFLDFMDIMNAPEFVPTNKPFALTRFIDASSEETENEEPKTLFDENIKESFQNLLIKHSIVNNKETTPTQPQQEINIAEQTTGLKKNIPNYRNSFYTH